jgi:hypothetical protein
MCVGVCVCGMCVCFVHVCMYMCVCVLCMCVFVCVRFDEYVCTSMCFSKYMRSWMIMSVRMQLLLYECMCLRVCVGVYICW